MTVAAVLKIRHNGRDITGRDEDRPENVPIRAWRQIMKHGFLKAGRYWHKTYLPLHFTKAAYYRYPGVYKRRTDAYFGRWQMAGPVPAGRGPERDAAIAKARAAHMPNVFRGTLKALSQLATARAFQTRVTIRIQTPNYIRKKPDANQPDVAAELGAVNSQEFEKLSSVVQGTVDADLKAFAASRTLPDLG